MPDTPSIRTLAALAGVSKATVSLALRDHPRIRPELRQRIQQLAAEAGYQPNALVANLLAQLRINRNTAYQSTLGLICVAEDPNILKIVPTFRDWIIGCKARAKECGYIFNEFWAYEPKVTPSRLVQILDARNIRGVIVVGVFGNGVVPQKFDPIWERSACVVLGTRPHSPLVHFVCNDQYATSIQAVEEVVKLGYRRPGLCVSRVLDDIIENKFTGGYWVAQSKLPLEHQIPVFDFDSKREKKFHRWLTEYRPDVIVTCHGEIEGWIESMKWRVPNDIGLVHLDRDSGMKTWAGMKQNNEFIGSAATDVLIAQLHRNEAGIPLFQKCMLIGSSWVPGLSVRKQTSRSQISLPKIPGTSAARSFFA